MRLASSGPSSSPVNERPSPIRSIQILPSGLTITSTTRLSARAAAITGPMAWRRAAIFRSATTERVSTIIAPYARPSSS